MWAIFRLHQFPLSNIKKTYQAFQAFSTFIYISIRGITMYYGITEQSVISRHRIVVSRPLGGRGSCALAAAFAAAFAASFTTWFETGQTCDYCDCTIQSFSPREYILQARTGLQWVTIIQHWHLKTIIVVARQWNLEWAQSPWVLFPGYSFSFLIYDWTVHAYDTVAYELFIDHAL